MSAFTTPTHLERLQDHPFLKDPGESFRGAVEMGFVAPFSLLPPPPPPTDCPWVSEDNPILIFQYSSPIPFGYYCWIYSIYFTYELVFPTTKRMGFADVHVPELLSKSDSGLQIHLTFIFLTNIHVLLT